MGRNRFVEPETMRIDIGDGDWIEVKKRLTIGESRRAQASVIKEVRADGRMTPDIEMLGKAEVLAYLVDWSLSDTRGKAVRIDSDAQKTAAIDGLTTDDFQVISEAISAHVQRMDEERETEKNAQGGGSVSSTTLPSVA